MAYELGRSMSDLRLEEYGPPYFIQYTVDDREELRITAVFGDVTVSSRERRRYITPAIRVGDYDLDNTNFRMWLGARVYYRPVVVGNDIDALRHGFWLATDAAYKGALGTFSQKQAFLQTRVVPDRLPDFTRVEPIEQIEPLVTLDIDQAHWESVIGDLATALTGCPDATSSRIDFEALVTNQYILTSEGARVRRGDRLYRLEVGLTALTNDGLTVADQRTYYARSESDLPKLDSLRRDLEGLVAHVNALKSAQLLEEYAGPMIFTGAAVGEVFRQLFMDNLAEPRRPLYGVDHLDQAARDKAKLARKVGRRVTARMLYITDDPTRETFHGSPLVGWFATDDEGVRSAPLELVQAGRLKTVYGSRTPSKKRATTSGHARGSVGRAVAARGANAIVTSEEGVGERELVARMLELCKEAELDYGVIVNRIADPSLRLGTGGMFTGLGGDERGLSTPLEAFRVYPDGRREPIRNMEFADVGVRLLRDIVAVGNPGTASVHNFLSENDDELPGSVVAPAILVEEVELRKTKAKPRSLPRLPSPLTQN